MAAREITKTCFYCEKEILPEDKIFWIGIEKPYGNVLMHREHYNLIKNDLRTYFTDNYSRLLVLFSRK